MRIPAKQWRPVGAGTALAVLVLCAGTAAAQAQPARDARADAVKRIMEKVERVPLDYRVTARHLFAAVPKLRIEAEAVVWAAARASAVATMADGTARVDVVVPGDRIQSRLEQTVARIKLPTRFAGISLARLGARGARFEATGRAGTGTPLPRVWQGVSEQDRDSAVRAARLQALNGAVQQLAEIARQRKAAGASRLFAVVGEEAWVRANARLLLSKGARDLQPPSFREDGTVQVLLEVPSMALFVALDKASGAHALPARLRKTLRRALAKTAGIGRGLGRAPGKAGLGQRQRLLWAEASGRPAAGKKGPQALPSARKAAEQVARGRLVEKIRRVPFDARRTVGDVLRARPELERGLGRFVVANARELESRRVGVDRWYIKLELNLDGLDAALK